MLKRQKISCVGLFITALFTTAVAHADTKNESYALGALFGTDVKGVIEAQKDVINYDQEKLLAGIKDAIAGKVDLNNPELTNTLKSIEDKVKAEHQRKIEEQAKKTQQEGEKFVAEFKKKADVKETKSGLLYRVEKAGEGASPKATDVVKVHYTGKLPNGKVFDSSVERNKPVEFALNQVIPGWTEGLQLIKKGGKIELVIPANLAYGDQDMGVIPANSTLHFDVELLDINPKK
ncbi:FKBP-type peptidyl-prolyl cis-trans isomerase [Pasteurellaceae bacterium 22721_9_1]